MYNEPKPPRWKSLEIGYKSHNSTQLTQTTRSLLAVTYPHAQRTLTGSGAWLNVDSEIPCPARPQTASASGIFVCSCACSGYPSAYWSALVPQLVACPKLPESYHQIAFEMHSGTCLYIPAENAYGCRPPKASEARKKQNTIAF